MALTRKLTKSLTRSLTRKLTGDELQQLFLEKFKLTLGGELIANGNFDDTSAWTVINDAAINTSTNSATIDGTSQTSHIVQGILTEGKTYVLTFDVSSDNGTGNRWITNNLGGSGLYYSITGNGSKSVTFTHTDSSSNLFFTARSGGSFVVSNISVKEAIKQAPLAAFSLRKLGNVSPYACRIRRSSDNTEAQVMFDASDRVSESSGVRNTSMNLVNFSEDFGNSFWTKSGLTMVGGYSDPTGGTNAYKATPSTGSAFHFFHNSSNYTVVSGKTYTYSIHLKADGYNFVTLNAPTGNSKGNAGPRVNLATGQKDGFYAADHDLHVEQLDDGWYRVSTQYVASGTSLRVDHGIFPTNAHAAYAGDGNSGVLFWGAQLEETTTYEAVGTEKVTDGGFDNPSVNWTSKSSSVSVSSGQAGFISSAENDFLQQNIGAVNGRKYKVTVTVTAYTAGAIAVRYPINKTASVHHINSVGTHTIEGVADQSNVNVQFQAKGTSTTLTIDNLSVLEHKPIPSEYISTPVVSNDGLQFVESDLDSFVGGENLLTRSEDFTNGSWNHVGGVQFIVENQTNHLGQSTASLIKPTVNNARVERQVAIVSGQSYVASVWAKRYKDGASNQFEMMVLNGVDPDNGAQYATQARLRVNVSSDGSFSTDETNSLNHSEVTYTSFGNGWYRASFKFTANTSDSNANFRLRGSPTNANGVDTDGDGNFDDATIGTLFFGPQLNNDSLKDYQKTVDSVRDGNCSIVSLYNAVGGEDIIQETQTKQPLLYKGAKLVKANSSPAIQFDGIDDVMKFSPDEFSNTLNLNSLSSFLVFKADYIAGFDYVFNLGTGTNNKYWYLPFINGGNFVVRYGTNPNSGTTGNTNVNLMSGVAGLQSGKFKAFLNNTQMDIRDVEDNSSATGVASIGGIVGTSNQFEGKILEIIVFDTEQHTTREAIEADIADFHNITLS